MKLSSAMVDVARIEQGEWIKDIPEMGDLELLVRGVENADYRRRRSEIIAAIPRRKRRNNILDQDVSDELLSTLLFETVLRGWKGLEDDDGKPIPFTPDWARKLLFEPAYRRYRDAVLYAASLVGEEAAEEIEDATKN